MPASSRFWLLLFVLGRFLLGETVAPVAAQTPAFRWVVPAGTAADPNDIGHRRAIATDAQGNTYVTGLFTGTLQLGATQLTTTTPGSLFVAKLDSAGNYLWVAHINGDDGSQGQGIAVGAQGEVYITGYVAGRSIRFGSVLLPDPGAASRLPDVFVAKLSASGIWLWATRGGGESSDVGRTIGVDGTGKVYVTGHFYSLTARFGATVVANSFPGRFTGDGFVAQLTAAGQWRWVQGVGGPNAKELAGLAVDRRGHVAITGYFQGAATFGPFTLNSRASSIDACIARLDSAGRWQWAVAAGSEGVDVATAVAVDTTTLELVVTGTYAGPDAQFGALRLLTTAPQTAFVTHLDSTGRFQWAVAPSTTTWSTGQSVAIDGLGNAYLLGHYGGTGLTLGATFLASAGGRDVFAARLGPSGAWHWAVGAGGALEDTGYSLALDGHDNLSLTGFIRGPRATFPPLSLATKPQYLSGFVARLPALGSPDDALLCPGGAVTLSAPPGALRYAWNTGATSAQVVIRQPGLYTVHFTNRDGSTRWLRYRVRAYSGIDARGLGADTTLCPGASFRLRASVPAGQVVTYRWSDGSTGSSLVVAQAGDYGLELRTACGIYRLSRRVTTASCQDVAAAQLPNIITPNNDGKNDQFVVPGLLRQQGPWALSVFTRWGTKIYETAAYANEWGANVPAGIYYYHLRAVGQSRLHKGWLEVVP